MQDAFLDAFSKGENSHAYLLSGDRNAGKLSLGLLLAENLLGESAISVDLLRISMESVNQALGSKNTASLGVAAIKQLVVPFVSSKSIYDKPRIVIIEEGDLLTPQAQNALLKSLEEPAGKCIFFILVEDLSKILTTIKSRCQKVQIQNMPEARLRAILTRQGVGEVQLASLLQASEGLVELALHYLAHPEAMESLEELSQGLLKVMSYSEAIAFSVRYAKLEPAQQEALLHRFEHLTALALQESLGKVTAYSYAFPSPWREAITGHRSLSLLHILQSISHARRMKNNQITWQAVLDYMFAQILEEIHKWQ